MKSKLKKRENPKLALQGELLMGEMIEKYGEYEISESLMKKLKREFDKQGRKMILSTKGNEIRYFNRHLEEALSILENLR